MRKNKLAQAATIITAILVVVSAIALFALAGRLFGETCEANIDTCKFSILVASKQKDFTFGNILTSIKCPRNELCDVEFTKNDIIKDNKINQDKAHKIIADAMTECWAMVGEGTDFFDGWENDEYCLVCKSINYDEGLTKFLEKTKQKVKNPIEYLIREDYSKGLTYYKYLYGEDHRYSIEQIDKMKEEPLPKGSEIVIFIDAKGFSLSSEITIELTSEKQKTGCLLIN